MKSAKIISLLFFFIIINSANSQSFKDVEWIKPSYEINHNGTIASGKQPEDNSNRIEASNSDFTPSGDFYNSITALNLITFSLNKPGFVNIKIYDEKGNTVDEIKRSSFGAGDHEIKWNNSKFTKGSYYCSIISGEFSITKKIK